MCTYVRIGVCAVCVCVRVCELMGVYTRVRAHS